MNIETVTIRKSKRVYESPEEESRCKAIIESIKQQERDRKKRNFKGNIHTRKKKGTHHVTSDFT